MATCKDLDPYKKISILSELSESLTSVSPQEFLQTLPEKVCSLLNVPVCILWEANQEQQEFQILATAGDIDDEYKKINLDFQHPGVKNLFKKNKISFLADVNQSEDRLHRFGDLEEINKRQFVSVMSVPLKDRQKKIGIIDILTQEIRKFDTWEKDLIEIVSNNVILAWQKIKLQKEKEKITNDKIKLQELINIINDMTAASETDEIWRLLKQGTEKLVNSKYIWLGRWNHLKGELELVEANKSSNNIKKLKFGKGVITQVIKNEKPISISNVDNNSYDYVQSWNDTQSELAIPLIDKVLIRDKPEINKKFGSKIIGVLNIESTSTNAFSDTSKERLVLLSRHAAIRLERLDYYQKVFGIRKVETKINQAQNFDQIIRIIIEGIREVLKFEWINISLVNSERTQIKSEYVIGIKLELEKEFKNEAIHSLNSNDIQADIVRTKNIEVPDNNDSRLDSKLFKNYGHENLIRVFLPMIEPTSNLVIGTVEVGYNREYRKYIYEQDVQILKSFVDYAVHALERKKSGLIDKITHELKSPIVGIKANASFVQRRFNDIRTSPQLIAIKFEDILTDCELLTYQIRQFEYFLGRSNADKVKLEETVVFRDIIVKTIYQLQYYLKEEYGFSTDNICYNRNDIKKTLIQTDKIKLNQVVYNLFINAFKYAHKDPKNFKINIEQEEDNKYFIIKFQDWGIGIKEDDKKFIFTEGFRSSQAIATVGGCGLGLSISKTIMRQLGGDLILFKISQPTEFHLKLPKNC